MFKLKHILKCEYYRGSVSERYFLVFEIKGREIDPIEVDFEAVEEMILKLHALGVLGHRTTDTFIVKARTIWENTEK